MTDLLHDLRYGFRNLLKAPAFTIAAILALGLGIGATTAIFSVVNGVVLKPLPFGEPERLVALWEANHEKNLTHERVSPVNFMDYRALSQVFSDATAWWRPEVTLRDQGREPVTVNTIEVSGNFMTVLGVRPTLGAGFPGDVFYSRDRVVMMSHRLWQSRFSSDPAIVGKTIRLNDDDYTVAGVMPAGFNFPGDTDLWYRLVWEPISWKPSRDCGQVLRSRPLNASSRPSADGSAASSRPPTVAGRPGPSVCTRRSSGISAQRS